MKTHLPKVNVDQRKWHVIDANGAILGRLAAQSPMFCEGKTSPSTLRTSMPATSSSSLTPRRSSSRQEGEPEKVHELFRLERRRALPLSRRGPRQAAREDHQPRRARHDSQEPAGQGAPDQAESLQRRPASGIPPAAPNCWCREVSLSTIHYQPSTFPRHVRHKIPKSKLPVTSAPGRRKTASRVCALRRHR